MSENKHQAVGWFEIPVTDMDRAIGFYEKVLGYKMERQQMGPLDMAWFPYAENHNSPGAGGSLVCHPDFYKPSNKGVLIYLISPSGDLQNELSRVEEAGGKVEIEKKLISEDVGYMSVFIDSEGNRVALHSTS